MPNVEPSAVDHSFASVSSLGPDEFRGRRSAWLSKEEIQNLSTVKGWIGTLHVGFEWLQIALAIVVGLHLQSWWVYPFLVVFIGSRQHALLILMHDAAHYRLYQSRALNDFVAEVFLAWPILTTMQGYRRNHWAHHRYVNTERDPDWVAKQIPMWTFPKSPLGLVAMLLRDLSGFNVIFLLVLQRQYARSPREEADGSARSASKLAGSRSFRLACYGFAAAALTYFHHWPAFFLYWLVPIATWLTLAMHLRSIAEHFAIPNASEPGRQTRSVRAGLWERWLIAPKNIEFHQEHHLYPSVPFHALPRLHARLEADHDYRVKAVRSDSYLAVLRECTRPGKTRRANIC